MKVMYWWTSVPTPTNFQSYVSPDSDCDMAVDALEKNSKNFAIRQKIVAIKTHGRVSHIWNRLYDFECTSKVSF